MNSLTNPDTNSLVPRKRANLSPDNIQALAELDVFRANLRATLTKQVMTNTSMLCKLEEMCNEYAPSGQEDYRQIVQAYAYREMQEIVGGEW